MSTPRPTTVLVAALLWAGAAGAQESALDLPPPGAQAAWDNLALALTQADGSVDVMLADPPDPDRLDALLDLMVLSTADQVRISTTYDMPGKAETLARIEGFIDENGLPWHVCHGWWLSPDSDPYATLIRDRLGGSLVFLDNDPTTGIVENPEASFDEAMRGDPAFAGTVGQEPRRIADAEDYFEAASAVWVQVMALHGAELDPARRDEGGWVDGC